MNDRCILSLHALLFIDSRCLSLSASVYRFIHNVFDDEYFILKLNIRFVSYCFLNMSRLNIKLCFEYITVSPFLSILNAFLLSLKSYTKIVYENTHCSFSFINITFNHNSQREYFLNLSSFNIRLI